MMAAMTIGMTPNKPKDTGMVANSSAPVNVRHPSRWRNCVIASVVWIKMATDHEKARVRQAEVSASRIIKPPTNKQVRVMVG